MGYRDDFYCAANVIGYSGQLQSFPTVYFQTKTGYGHITQEHDLSQNVGRNAVEDGTGYTIGNEMVNGVLKLVEKKNGHIFHESRSTLTKVGQNDQNTLAVLTQAIWKCPEEKYISAFSKKDLLQIGASENAKKDFHALLKQGDINLRHV